MKVKTIVKKLYLACLKRDKEMEKNLFIKAIKKSLKHKKTHVIN